MQHCSTGVWRPQLPHLHPRACTARGVLLLKAWSIQPHGGVRWHARDLVQLLSAQQSPGSVTSNNQHEMTMACGARAGFQVRGAQGSGWRYGLTSQACGPTAACSETKFDRQQSMGTKVLQSPVTKQRHVLHVDQASCPSAGGGCMAHSIA